MPPHRHVWKIVSQTVQESSAETLRRLGAQLTMQHGWANEIREVTRADVIVKARCEHCGSERVYRV